MLRQIGRFRSIRSVFVKRSHLNKEIFLKKEFHLHDIGTGKNNKARIQEEYLLYTMKLEDPLMLIFSSSFCNASAFYTAEVKNSQTFYQNVRCLNVNIEDHPWVVDEFKLSAVPTFSVWVNQKEVIKVSGRQEQDYVVALMHYLAQLYQTNQNASNAAPDTFSFDRHVKQSSQPQWFPFDPSPLLDDWEERNLRLDLQCTTPWPSTYASKLPQKRRFLSSFTKYHTLCGLTEFQRCLCYLIENMIHGEVVRFRHMLNLSFVMVYVSNWRLANVVTYRGGQTNAEHPEALDSDYFTKQLDYKLDQCPPQQPGGGWAYYGIPVGKLNSQYFWDEMEISKVIYKHLLGRAH